MVLKPALFFIKSKDDDWILSEVKAGKRGLELLTELNRLLESHPLLCLDRWLDFARSHSDDPALQKFYESNARQIITVWGPPVNDYSCRIWSGLVRDFYRERMIKVLESLKAGTPFDSTSWELGWVAGSGISVVQPYPEPLSAAKNWFKKRSWRSSKGKYTKRKASD